MPQFSKPSGLILLTVMVLFHQAQGLACGAARTDFRCGSGTTENAACPTGYCCSEYGWCGVGLDYCNLKTQYPCLTSAPSTAAPTTAAPTSRAPTTAAPTTAAPTTRAPTTAAPTTAAPTTRAPTTAAPTTAAPTTRAPTTAAPTTAAPTTRAPTTAAPTTAAPTTRAPTTLAPTTVAPTTAAPTTRAPTTVAPTTLPPTTAAPTTRAPTTAAPTTAAPTTKAPTTSAPTVCPLPRSDNMCGTNTPDNAPCASGYCCSEYGWCGNTTEYCNANSQSTCGSSTSAPTTRAPTTAAPTSAPTTKAPTTAAPTPSGSYKYYAMDSCGPKMLALSFDDGPNFASASMQAALASRGVKATVFVNGNNWPDLTPAQRCASIKAAADAGHDVQSHSYTHPDFLTLSNASALSDLKLNKEWMVGCGLPAPKFFRPPFGNFNQKLAELVKDEYIIAFWNGRTDDTAFDKPTADQLINVLKTTMPDPKSGDGALILAHDASSYNLYLDYIDWLIKTYVEPYGYRFVTISECWSSCGQWKTGVSGRVCTGSKGVDALDYFEGWT